MSYNNKHHFPELVLHSQSYTAIEQIPPTSGIVAAVQRTDSGGVAGMPRILPLDVMIDISRDPARQPALPGQGSGPNTGSMQISLSQSNGQLLPHKPPAVTLVQFDLKSHTDSGTNTKRPAAQANAHSAEKPGERGVRIDPDSTHSPQKLAERPLGGVRQDKARLENARTASRQPARDTDVSRAPLTNNSVVRSQHVAGANKKLVQVTLWVDPDVKAHLERKALEEGLSLSPAGAAFLRKAVQQDTDLQYSALLRPIIGDAIAKEMAGIATRLTWLLVRIAFDAGQTRSLVTNILGRQPGVTDSVLKTLLEGSTRSAKANIMRRTPQISQLIEAVEQWMVEDERGVKEKPYD